MSDERTDWSDRVLCVLGSLGPGISEVDEHGLLERIGARYGRLFDADDWKYVQGEPRWYRATRSAAGDLESDGLVSSVPGLRLTEAGQDRVQRACAQEDKDPPPRLGIGPPVATDASPPTPEVGAPAGIDVPPPPAGVLTPALRDAVAPKPGGAEVSIMIELNPGFRAGPERAFDRLRELWKLVDGPGEPLRVSGNYVTGVLSADQIGRLEAANGAAVDWADRCIIQMWPDFKMHRLIDRSVVTIKADAAHRSFNCYGDGIVWAVVDSGISGEHPHFQGYHTLDDDSVKDLHRNFTGDVPVSDGALVDDLGHGTHVAGIIAGGLELWQPKRDVVVAEERYSMAAPNNPILKPRSVPDPNCLAGMAPRTRLVSLKVLGGSGPAASRVGRVVQALNYVRDINVGSEPRIHGVNLSLGYEFDAEWDACGRSPLCMEIDKLVRSGVVVVVAAGNSGSVTVNPTFASPRRFSMGMTINDPGNAARAITVGSTHRDCPHRYGVSYFSSRGPTSDGRRKPDLVAPGDGVVSAAAGEMSKPVVLTPEQSGAAVYVSSRGTSMAAPHVSGAVAAFLSVRREFIGDPEEVKRVFVESATSLGRDANCQGAGLVDLMRAMQAV
ncbi:S8 family serine peptidase [Rhodococcus sp. NPDC004095]